MSRRAFLLLIGVSVVSVGFVFGRQLFPPAVPKQPETTPVPPSLFVAPAELNFGDVWESNHHDHTFRVTNQSQEPLRVEGIALSCSCLSITPDRFTLKPGESIPLTITVDLTAKSRDSEDAAFLISPTIKLPNGQNGPYVKWTLVGRSRRFLTLDRLPTFGRVSVLDQPLSPVTVGIQSAIPLDRGIVATIIDRPDLRASVRPDPIDARKFVLTVSSTQRLPVDIYRATVTLKPEDSREIRLPTISFTIEGRLVPDVESLPSAVLGGGRKVGSNFEQSITLASLGQRSFKVLSNSIIGPGLSVRQVGDEFVIVQQCLAAGQQTGRVMFQVEAADGRYAIPVEVTYVGIAD